MYVRYLRKVIAKKLERLLPVEERLNMAEEDIKSIRDGIQKRIRRLTWLELRIKKNIEGYKNSDLENKEELIARSERIMERVKKAKKRLIEKKNLVEKKISDFENRKAEILAAYNLAKTEKEVQDILIARGDSNTNILENIIEEIEDIENDVETTSRLVQEGVYKQIE